MAIAWVMMMMPAWQASALEPDTEAPPAQTLAFGADLFPYVGTSSGAPEAARVVSLNLVGGLSGGTRLLELGGAFNLTTGEVRGVQLAGAANINAAERTGVQLAGALNANRGEVRGLGVSGAANINAGDVRGLQISGGANINADEFHGAQISGALNLTRGAVEGAQISGGANVNDGPLRGLQLGGGANINAGDVRGLQISGGANINAGDVRGLQISGGANINAGDVRGLQISGGLNLTRGDMHGLQIGAINITQGRARGFQVGVVNVAPGEHAGIAAVGIYRGGYIYPELQVSDEGLVQAGVRHGSGAFYHTYSVGTQAFATTEGQGPSVALSLRMGWRTEFSDALEVSLDAGVTSLIGDARANLVSLFQVRPLLSVGLGERLAIFGGPTLTLDVLNERGATFPDGLLAAWELGEQVHLRPGATLGLRLRTH
ncbi:hypothetical protein DL240_18970 [Lujinxingia litoralis]|uniref:Uncharacterized protein n=1 Tax=Lujinxingia litoralis TaxID=2211119 RepID=A0A328C0F4_9DELT|nr:hypothetical protein DL240_18970 [Lujinxingia litoralis]